MEFLNLGRGDLEEQVNRAGLRVLLVIVIFGFAAAIRLRNVGDIIAHGDEQFYLLVGDRMLRDGAVPYIDIWDRKPVGLFLLFAAIRLLGGMGIVEYQLVASLFAAATAAFIGLWIAGMAAPAGQPGSADDSAILYRPSAAGLIAALLYLAVLQSHLGFGGQAEVFLNLFVVASGFIVYRLLVRDGAAGLLPAGVVAMLVMGVALQIKPTAVFPGIWLGSTLLWLAWRARWTWPRRGGAALAWIGAALLPTLAALGWYAAHGHLDAYVFANFLSIAAKGSDGSVGAEALRAAKTLLRLGVPFGVAIVLLGVSVAKASPVTMSRPLAFVFGWFLSGVAAFLALGAAYPHYALVAAPMGCLLVGMAIRLRGSLGFAMIAVALAMSGWLLNKDIARIRDNRIVAPRLAALAADIRPQLKNGCLYVYHGPVILYTLTGSCVPTRFVFPNHLSTAAEASGLGIDATAEVARILRGRPPVIIDAPFGFHVSNTATEALVRRTLAADYVRTGVVNGNRTGPMAIAYRRRQPGEPPG